MYGYDAAVPDDLVAYGPCVDAQGISGSSHGFSGFVAHARKASISVFVEYYSPSPAPGFHLEDHVLGSEHPSAKPLEINRRDTMPGGIPAKHVTARYRLSTSSRETIVDTVYALRVVNADTTIPYQVALSVPAGGYEKANSHFDQMVDRFAMIDVADESYLSSCGSCRGTRIKHRVGIQLCVPRGMKVHRDQGFEGDVRDVITFSHRGETAQLTIRSTTNPSGYRKSAPDWAPANAVGNFRDRVWQCSAGDKGHDFRLDWEGRNWRLVTFPSGHAEYVDVPKKIAAEFDTVLDSLCCRPTN